jgi:mannosyl-3-phosphoglycerate phosphatase
MKDDAFPGLSVNPTLVLFTDLDGTLLDPETYSWEEAGEALDLCRQRGVKVIPASSKTRAEMEILRDRISLPGPFISENGGGIFLPVTFGEEPPPGALADEDLWKWPQGTPYAVLRRALKEMGKELGYTLIGFSDMGIDRIADLTGLDISTARLAASREFDEPFLVDSPVNPDMSALRRAAEQRGLVIAEGGRFIHLQGRNDKGLAMQQLIFLYEKREGKVVSAALGDSPNDFSMLERADFPVLIRSKRDYPELIKRIPGLVVTRGEGPKGWNEAVLHILQSRSEQV